MAEVHNQLRRTKWPTSPKTLATWFFLRICPCFQNDHLPRSSHFSVNFAEQALTSLNLLILPYLLPLSPPSNVLLSSADTVASQNIWIFLLSLHFLSCMREQRKRLWRKTRCCCDCFKLVTKSFIHSSLTDHYARHERSDCLHSYYY